MGVKFTYIIIIFLFSLNGFAIDALYEFSGTKHDVVEINHRLVSANCEKKDCKAKSIEIKPAEVKDGEDPALAACLISLKGAYIQLHDGKQNEESVCVFEDKSFITFSSIRAELYLK